MEPAQVFAKVLIEWPIRLGLELLKLWVLLKLLACITGCAASGDAYQRQLERCVEYAKTEQAALQCVEEVKAAWAH